MSKKWYVKAWMPQGKGRRTYEQAIVDGDSKAHAVGNALLANLIAPGRRVTVRRATEADAANPQVRYAR